ncbi:MAG: LuxR C-terminal-related transcriptional regulator [Propionibacteriaceae bacterium]|jgi:DNA-binding CsgD family transcriptional regulator|nr:LuxR C-terminal-related transcriptional regulator [Propionibacteriaceae bacterium]
MRNIDMGGVVFGWEINQIVNFLRQGVSVHLVGPRRSGRSQILRELADWLDDDGSSVLMMRGNSALKNEPFAAFVHTSLGEELARRTLAEVVAGITRFAGRRSPVLICDDADDLDAASVGAIQAAHRENRLVAVTSSRPHQLVPADSLMVGLAPAVQLRVTNLELSRLHDLAVEILGGPMEPMALSRVAMRSGGLYGLARAMLIVGKETKQIVRNDVGLWVIPGELWSEYLTSAVEPYLAGIDSLAYEGATALASAGPLPVKDAEALLGHNVLRDLFALGLAHYVEYGSNAVAGIFPPLLSDYLSHEGSPLGRSRALDFRPSQPWPSLRHAPSSDVSIISHQVEQQSVTLVEQRRQAWVQDPTPANATALVQAMVNTWSPPVEVSRVISNTAVVGEDLPGALFVVWAAQWNASQTGDVDAAVQDLERYRKQMPHFDALLRAGQAHICFNSDQQPTKAMLAPATPDDDPNGADFLNGVTIERMIALGKTTTARNLLRDYQPMTPTLQGERNSWEALSTVMAGDLENGIQKALTMLAAARQRMQVGEIQSAGYAAALGMVLAGRLQEAGDVLESILSTTPSAAFQNTANSGVLSLGALMALWQGRPAYARALASRTLPLATKPGPFPGMVPWAVEAMMRWSTTSTNPGPDLWEVAERRMKTGYVASGLFISLEAVDYSSSDKVSALISKTLPDIESPMLVSLAQYILAANSQDLDALAKLIAQFQKSGAMHFAIRAAVLRALLLRRQGQVAEAAAQAAEAWDISKVSGYERAGFFALLREEVGLSAREYEVLGLLSTGMVNAEAASILDMSVRTVETHLHNVARKVGLVGKEALVEAINTWLRPAGK